MKQPVAHEQPVRALCATTLSLLVLRIICTCNRVLEPDLYLKLVGLMSLCGVRNQGHERRAAHDIRDLTLRQPWLRPPEAAAAALPGQALR
jgi:hypothetical protein